MRVRKKHKLLAILIGSALCTSAARISYSFLRYREVAAHFQKIHTGMQRGEVVRRLGKPNYHAGACGEIAPIRDGCVIEYDYSHPLAPLIPEYYVVTFSKDDRVLEAEPWTSP